MVTGVPFLRRTGICLPRRTRRMDRKRHSLPYSPFFAGLCRCMER
ncbi:hypothetical protein HMPREF3293_01588 [Christensenella minuta]|uniref:Uncharacterized protein n=1 Tax=Christensenella minuta TaxID=626937 RepID=A0A136Q4B3_9FIRM|nr:hypothetical protein HMPREF3293_01588 [Christensenella minuta]